MVPLTAKVAESRTPIESSEELNARYLPFGLTWEVSVSPVNQADAYEVSPHVKACYTLVADFSALRNFPITGIPFGDVSLPRSYLGARRCT